MGNDERNLERVFEEYREACEEVEPNANFMPRLWQKIETRRPNFWLIFQQSARKMATASAALCLLLLVLNWVSSFQAHFAVPSYTDALMADHTAEKTYYTEAIRSANEAPSISFGR